jgi:ubiquinone/menaquinone biosynthesis C-methylase UbiE
MSKPTTNPHKSVEYMRQSIAKCMNEEGINYDAFYNDINYVSPGIHIMKYYDKCISLINEKDSWLDLGCGSAHYIVKAIEDKDIDLHGIEVVDKSVELANQNGVNCLKGSIAEKLPYNDNTFNLLTATDVLEHLHPKDVSFSLKEAHRVLKDDCYALLAPFPKPDKTGVIHLTVEPLSWWIDKCAKAGLTFIEKCGEYGLVFKKIK